MISTQESHYKCNLFTISTFKTVVPYTQSQLLSSVPWSVIWFMQHLLKSRFMELVQGTDV